MMCVRMHIIFSPLHPISAGTASPREPQKWRGKIREKESVGWAGMQWF
jgi:hypothetical protein